MKLIKARIRGTRPVLKTSWFELGAGLNIFQFEDQVEGSRFLQTLQTLHPSFDCQRDKVFDDLDHFEKAGNYIRHIDPAKRTVAIGVFTSTPELVNKLGQISPLLYETDRIEIGRRMDYSQWSNFVELASSSRWSELATDVHQVISMLEASQPTLAKRFTDFAGRLKPTDRVKLKTEKKLLDIITSVSSTKDSKLQEFCNRIKVTALRATHFQQARGLVSDNLPLLVHLHLTDKRVNLTTIKRLLDLLFVHPQNTQNNRKKINEELTKMSVDGSHLQLVQQESNRLDAVSDNKKIDQLTYNTKQQLPAQSVIISIARALSRILYSVEPIFLIDSGPHNDLPGNVEAIHTKLLEISKNCQTLLVCPQSLQLPQDLSGPCYHRNDLLA